MAWYGKMTTEKKHVRYSILVPVYNSSTSLVELHSRIVNVMEKTGSFEIVYVSDGSRDDSWKIISGLAEDDSRVTAINLSKNFGQHNALMCAFSYAQGDFSITIDDDLQIPPEEIPRLIAEIEKGYDVVYGTYPKKKHSFFRNMGSWLIRSIFSLIFKVQIPITSFRIITRHIVQSIVGYNKSFTYIDGLISWHTDSIGSVEVRHESRQQGRSGYSLYKLISLGLNLLTNFSLLPLQMATIVGIFMAFSAFGIGFYFIYLKIVHKIAVEGWTSLMVSTTLFSGIILVLIGLLGEYLGRVHLNINNMPQYAIREIVGNYKTEDNSQKNKEISSSDG